MENLGGSAAGPAVAFREKHPSALYSLFFTEMWERFSYYGMRALLVLYLVNAIEIPRDQALQIYATYTSLVYLTPLLGGYLADRFLGTRRAILIGAIVMAAGHFAMAFPSLLYFGLGLLIAGNGFFKPNISTLVGGLYSADDPRRDGGFTLFYMGINLGAFLAPLVCGTLGEQWGWHYGFAAAGIGMVIGLVTFVRGEKHLGSLGLPMGRSIDGSAARLSRDDWRVITVTSVVVVIVVASIVTLLRITAAWWPADPASRSIILLLLLCSALLFSVAKLITRQDSREHRQRIVAVVIMALFVVFFWMGFEQAGGTMNLFADKLTDRDVLGWEVPASYFQAVNPLFIVVLAPAFSLLWLRLHRYPAGQSPVVKQAAGMIILGAGFVVLAIAQNRAQDLAPVSPLWLLSVYLLHTLGELCLSPIGLSMASKLAPPRDASLVMGVWFTAMALASLLAGNLELLLRDSGVPLYWFLVASSIGAGLLLLALAPWLHRMMGAVR
jgi:POT family proton-dependent oligopeptide transporter